MSTRRKYSDIEKAEAIAACKANGGNIFRTAHELNIPWATLAQWVKGTSGINDNLPVSVIELREQKEEELSIICERIARKYLAQAGDEWCIAATPGSVAMTTAAIAIDKTRLLRGESTMITETRDGFLLSLYAHVTDAVMFKVGREQWAGLTDTERASLEAEGAIALHATMARTNHPTLAATSAWGKWQGVIEANLAAAAQAPPEVIADGGEQ